MSESTFLTREAILALNAAEVGLRVVEIPGMGKVHARTITAGDAMKIKESLAGSDLTPDKRANQITMRSIQLSILDGDSQPIFQTVDEIEALSASIFARLVQAIGADSTPPEPEEVSKN